MAALAIVTIPDAILREQAAPIERFDPDLRQLASDMLELMIVADGVGLAGPQIGRSQRIFVMHLRPEDTRVPDGHPLKGRGLVLVNPEIVETSEALEEGMEGCLSIPDYVGLVPRHTRVVVQARNEWGKAKRYDVEGFVARVMQHEIDHLHGVLFPDRLTGDDKLFKVAPAGEAPNGTEPTEAEMMPNVEAQPEA